MRLLWPNAKLGSKCAGLRPAPHILTVERYLKTNVAQNVHSGGKGELLDSRAIGTLNAAVIHATRRLLWCSRFGFFYNLVEAWNLRVSIAWIPLMRKLLLFVGAIETSCRWRIASPSLPVLTAQSRNWTKLTDLFLKCNDRFETRMAAVRSGFNYRLPPKLRIGYRNFKHFPFRSQDDKIWNQL